MNVPQRTLLLERAFLQGRWEFLHRKLRPITILSLELCRHNGLDLLRGVAAFRAQSLAEQTEQVATFIYIHSEPWQMVLEETRNREVPYFQLDQAEHVCAAFAIELADFCAMIEAASFEPRLRKGYERETPPDDLAPTCWLSEMVDEIGARYHWSEKFILRKLPFVRAVQYHHHCMSARAHLWTTVPGKALSEQVKGLEAVTATLAALPRAEDV